MAIQTLLTGFSLFAAAFCVYFAWRAGESAERAAHSEHRLAILRGQVAGLEAALEALNNKHAKLAGRVYADQYWSGKQEQQPELNPVCENWSVAQREGPTSDAASCECDYCVGRREERARRRASMRSGVKS